MNTFIERCLIAALSSKKVKNYNFVTPGWATADRSGVWCQSYILVGFEFAAELHRYTPVLATLLIGADNGVMSGEERPI